MVPDGFSLPQCLCLGREDASPHSRLHRDPSSAAECIIAQPRDAGTITSALHHRETQTHSAKPLWLFILKPPCGPLFQYSLELTQQHRGLVFPPVESAQVRAAARSGNPAGLCRRLHVFYFEICSAAQSKPPPPLRVPPPWRGKTSGLMRRVITVNVITVAGFVCVCLQRLTAEIIGKSKKKKKRRGKV